MDSPATPLRWYEQPEWDHARDLIKYIIPRRLKTIKKMQFELRGTSHSSPRAARLAWRMSHQVDEISAGYDDIHAAMKRSKYTESRTLTLPGLEDLEGHVAAVKWHPCDYVPGGPRQFVMPMPPWLLAEDEEDTIASDPLALPGHGTHAPAAGHVHDPPHDRSGTTSLASAPHPAAPGYGFGNSHPYGADIGRSAPYLGQPPPANFAQAPPPVSGQPPTAGVNKRRRRNDSPSAAPPPLRRKFLIDKRSRPPDPDVPLPRSEPQHNTATRGEQRVSLSRETMACMEQISSMLDYYVEACLLL